MTIAKIIEVMEAHHKTFDPSRPTCDGVIVGDTYRECTGVALTCCPTARVIRQAAEQGCNFLICHEPTFFDGLDSTDWLEGDPVYHAKKALLEETGMTVYRNHDHLHSDRPDGIFTGVAHKLDWEEYALGGGYMPGRCFMLPPTTVAGVAEQLARAMHIDGIRIIGDPDMEVERAAVVFHFLGGDMDKECLRFIKDNNVQVVIPGEVVDWTIGEYVQDGLFLGRKLALLNPGHFNWEEPGMEYMAGWLAADLGGSVPVRFIQSGNQYQWLSFAT